jgi:hypothetical protein
MTDQVIDSHGFNPARIKDTWEAVANLYGQDTRHSCQVASRKFRNEPRVSAVQNQQFASYAWYTFTMCSRTLYSSQIRLLHHFVITSGVSHFVFLNVARLFKIADKNLDLNGISAASMQHLIAAAKICWFHCTSCKDGDCSQCRYKWLTIYYIVLAHFCLRS